MESPIIPRSHLLFAAGAGAGARDSVGAAPATWGLATAINFSFRASCMMRPFAAALNHNRSLRSPEIPRGWKIRCV